MKGKWVVASVFFFLGVLVGVFVNVIYLLYCFFETIEKFVN